MAGHATLGDSERMGHRTVRWMCEGCRRYEVRLDLAEMIEKYGRGQSVPELARHETCKLCGPRGYVETRPDFANPLRRDR